MRNSFNILLIALALFDNTYLVGSILESFRKRFQLYTDLVIESLESNYSYNMKYLVCGGGQHAYLLV